MQGATKTHPDQERLDMLRHVAENHVRWLQSDGKDGRRANLSNQDLSGISLRGVYLPEANFRSANLTGTDFSEADLQGADFSEAQLDHTNFRDAKLDGANFSRAVANHAYFDRASLVEANFSHVSMEGASAPEADFSGVKFRDAVLSQSDFTKAKMLHANMRYARAVECTFDQADLSRADCRDAQFDYTRFRAAMLYETQLRNASFEHVYFTDTDFSRVIDLDSQYQVESMAWEKRSIREEIENLYSVKEEVSHFESQILKQRQDLAKKRRILSRLNEQEEAMSGRFLDYMRWFRRLAMFWFASLAMLMTLIFGGVIDVSLSEMSQFQQITVSALLAGVLGAHLVSAALSFNMSQLYARYVRDRGKRLENARAEGLDEPEAESVINANAPTDEPVDPTRVTYL